MSEFEREVLDILKAFVSCDANDQLVDHTNEYDATDAFKTEELRDAVARAWMAIKRVDPDWEVKP